MNYRTRRKCRQCCAIFVRYKSECQRRAVKFCSSQCARAHQVGRPHKGSPRHLKPHPCAFCAREYMPRHAGSRFCSRACMKAEMRGPKSPNWKGGRTVDSNGYIWIRKPDHPRAKGYGYVKEHHVVIEEKIGRLLRRGETVHHINGNRGDNNPENLQLRTGKHGHGAVLVCGDCGSSNIVYAPIADRDIAFVGTSA